MGQGTGGIRAVVNCTGQEIKEELWALRKRKRHSIGKARLHLKTRAVSGMGRPEDYGELNGNG